MLHNQQTNPILVCIHFSPRNFTFLTNQNNSEICARRKFIFRVKYDFIVCVSIRACFQLKYQSFLSLFSRVVSYLMVTIKFNFFQPCSVKSFIFLSNLERRSEEEAILVFSLESEIRHDMSKLEKGKEVNIKLRDDESHRYWRGK